MKLNQKGFAHLLLLLILLGGLAAGVYLTTSKDPLKLFSKAAAPKSQSSKTDLQPKGYIVQFKDPPAVANYISKGKGSAGEISAQSYEQSLKSKHEAAKKDIFQRLAPTAQDVSKIKILGEYTKSFNGLALDITEQQANKLRSSPYVKQLYPNLQIKANLAESVPLIGADKAWQLKDNQGRSITGEGVTVAVLDTGVDSTHPDLGASQISERDFQKIISDSGYHLVMSSDKSRIAFDKTGATSSEQPDKHTTIYVYSLTGQKLNEFSVPENEKWIAQLVIEENYLALFGYGDYGENAGVSMYNLTTGEHKRIENVNIVGTMHIFENKLYFGTGMDSGTESRPSFDVKNVAFHTYDMVTGSVSSMNSAIAPTDFYTIMGAFDKARVAFPVPEGNNSLCGKSLYVLDLSTSQGQSYNPPEIGPIADFKGDEILYAACNPANFDSTGSSYYLFNIKTGLVTKLTYLSTTDQQTISTDLTYAGLSSKPQSISPQAFAFSWERPNLGLIGDNVIYFRRNYNSDKIIIYNKSTKNYYRLNFLWPFWRFVNAGDMICFNHSGVYCHNYDSTNSYDIPSTLSVFNNKVVSGYNFVYPGEFTLDDNGHGTHVSAIVAGNGSFKGVAPEAKIVAYKVLNNSGSGYFSDVIAALEKAVGTKFDNDSNNDIDVVNISLGATCYGGYTSYCGPDDPPSQTVDTIVDAGITVVVTAGNSGPSYSTVGTPGTARKAITVGAVDKSKQVASFSSRGPAIWNNETIKKPEVVAPGVSICAAEWADWNYTARCRDDKHIAIDGTSMAAPHVAGLAVLIKQANPALTPLQIKNLIMANATKLAGYDQNTQGAGLINAENTIKNVSSPLPTPTSPSNLISQSITLGYGNNLIGLTIDKGDNYLAEDFLKDLNKSTPDNNKLTRIYKTDPASNRNITHNLGTTTDNFPIKPGEGYFVVSNNWKGTAGISGTIPQQPTVIVPKGNSLVSFWQVPSGINKAEALLQTMKAQGIKATQIAKYQYGSYQGHVIGYPFNNFDIKPGEGYSIKNTGDTKIFSITP